MTEENQAPEIVDQQNAEQPEASGSANDAAGKQEDNKGKDGKKRRPPMTGPPETVAKPDRSAFDSDMKAMESQISEKDQAITGIRTKLDNIKSRQAQVRDQRRAIIEKKQALQTKVHALSDERRSLVAQLEGFNSRRNALREAISSMGKGLGMTDEKQIDEKIQEIEYRMTTTSMPLREEKALITEIKTLKMSKEKVAKLTADREMLKANADQEKAISEQVKNKSAALDELRTQVKSVQGEFDKLNASISTGESWESLQKQNKALYGELKVLRDAIRTRRDEFRRSEHKYDRFLEDQRRWRAQQKREAYLAMKADEASQREALEEEEKAEKASIHPFQNEITACQDLAKYFRSMLPKTSTVAEASAPKTYEEGTLMNGKGAGEDEFLVAPSAKGKKGKKKGGKKAAPALSHPVDAIVSANSIGAALPSNADAVQSSLSQVEELEAKFQNMTTDDRSQFDADRKAKATAASSNLKSAAKKDGKKDASEEFVGPAPVDVSVSESTGFAFRDAVAKQ